MKAFPLLTRDVAKAYKEKKASFASELERTEWEAQMVQYYEDHAIKKDLSDVEKGDRAKLMERELKNISRQVNIIVRMIWECILMTLSSYRLDISNELALSSQAI